MGQEPYSCDTTQIDACASTRFMRHHACPMDNGTGSRRHLLGCPFKPPSEVHSHDHAPLCFHHPELSKGLCLPGTTLPHRFWFFNCYPHYMHCLFPCQALFCRCSAVNYTGLHEAASKGKPRQSVLPRLQSFIKMPRYRFRRSLRSCRHGSGPESPCQPYRS